MCQVVFSRPGCQTSTDTWSSSVLGVSPQALSGLWTGDWSEAEHEVGLHFLWTVVMRRSQKSFHLELTTECNSNIVCNSSCFDSNNWLLIWAPLLVETEECLKLLLFDKQWNMYFNFWWSIIYRFRIGIKYLSEHELPASQSKHITAGPAETIESPPPPAAQTLSSPQTQRSRQPGTHSQQPKYQDHGVNKISEL